MSYTFFTQLLHKQLKQLHFAYTAVTQHIIQQLEAEGHHLDIVAGMKGYTAIIVDIIGYGALKPQNSNS